MFAGLLIERVDDGEAADVSFAGPWERIAAFQAHGRTHIKHEKANDGAREHWTQRPAHGAKVANGLHDQEIQNAGERRGIVRVGPNYGEDGEHTSGKRHPREAHLATANSKGERRKNKE